MISNLSLTQLIITDRRKTSILLTKTANSARGAGRNHFDSKDMITNHLKALESGCSVNPKLL